MDPVVTARQEALERVFNALWREDFAAGKRLSRACRRGSACAIISWPAGAELLAPLRGIESFGLLRTGFPYYVRLPQSQGAEAEVVESAEELLALLPGEIEMLEQISAKRIGFSLVEPVNYNDVESGNKGEMT